MGSLPLLSHSTTKITSQTWRKTAKSGYPGYKGMLLKPFCSPFSIFSIIPLIMNRKRPTICHKASTYKRCKYETAVKSYCHITNGTRPMVVIISELNWALCLFTFDFDLDQRVRRYPKSSRFVVSSCVSLF